MVFSWGFFRSLSKCAQCLIASARAHIHKSTLKSTRTRCLAHSKVTHIAWNRFIHNMKRDCYFPHGAPTRPCFFSLFCSFFFLFTDLYWQFCYRYPPLVSPESCIQGRRRGEIVYDWFRNYLDAHRDFPEDSLVSMIHVNDWQHSYAHGLYLADRPTVELLQSMKLKGDLENAILIFLSDHGCKIGDYPKT